MSTHSVELERLRLDGGTQPRAELDEPTVRRYMEAMEAGVILPPIVTVYDGTNYWLVDGFHRAEAAALIGMAVIEAIVHQGTIEDAQWMSFGVNAEHGLPRSNADKRRAVEAALRHPRGQAMSDRAIAEHCKVGAPLVGTMRSELGLRCNPITPETRTGRDGKSYPVAAKPAAAPPSPPAPAPEPGPEPIDESKFEFPPTPADAWPQTPYKPERQAPKPVTELPRRPMGEASRPVRNAIHDLVFEQVWEAVAHDLAALDRDDSRNCWVYEVQMALANLQKLNNYLQRFAA